MRTFSDNSGRVWAVAVNVATIKQVKAQLEINLLEAVTGDLIERLKVDPCLLCDILYCVCSKEAREKNVDSEAFGCAMAGDALAAATKCFLLELIDFFPSDRRKVLAKAFTKVEEAEAQAVLAAETYLENPQILKQVDDKLKSIFHAATK